jgi:Cu(I)/Ag(I) efflux system membrane fusion protein
MKNLKLSSGTMIMMLANLCLFTSLLSPSWASEDIGASSKIQHPKVYWTCPMHHHIHNDQPGLCPICGMTLVKVDDETPTHSDLSKMPKNHAPIKLSLDRQQMIGVKYGTVEKKPLFKTIHAAGRVAFDPELYTVQNEYQEAARQWEEVKDSSLAEVRHSADRMLQSSRLRLKVLGLSDQQIASLAKGTVESDQSLLLHQAGDDVYIYAEVQEIDLPDVRQGLAAQLSLGTLEGQTLRGKVISLDRVLNPSSRTAKARILVPKARTQLRPQTYVNVSILSPLGVQVTVPFDAVFETGTQDWVFVKRSDGTLEPRLMTIKYRAGDEIAVESGVHEGEQIVTSANFLIDSESRLKAEVMPAGNGKEAVRPSCPSGQHWDTPMAMCMPGGS